MNWTLLIVWVILGPLIVVSVILSCCCGYRRRGRWRNNGSCGLCYCCCGQERVYVNPPPQYPTPGYTSVYPYPMQYPMQRAPMYFYPQGYIPPPPPHAVMNDQLTVIFRRLDKDNSGGIDINEAIIGAKEFGALGYFLASDEQVKAFFEAVDRNKDNKLDFSEFSNMAGALAAKHPHPQPPQVTPPPRYAPTVDEKLTTIFRRLDKDNSGGIDINEAMIGVKEFGALGYFLASDEQVKAFFDAADGNKDNKIDFSEFSNMAGALAVKHPHPQPPVNISHNIAVQGEATLAIQPKQVTVDL